MHDWTKFLPDEWFPYVRYFYGSYPSENDITRAERYARHDLGIHVRTKEDVQLEFDLARNLHYKRNWHYWQHWLVAVDGTSLPYGADIDDNACALNMESAAYREMIADWIGTGLAQDEPDVRAWYESNKDKIHLHDYTRQQVEAILFSLDA